MFSNRTNRHLLYPLLSVLLLITFNSNSVLANTYANTVSGTGVGEQLLGTNDSDLIQGLAGDDQIYGFSGNDRLEGGDDNDRLQGGNGSNVDSGDDILIGGDGNDILVGEDGNDSLEGGLGGDHYYYSANTGVDSIIDPEAGQDVLFFLDAAATHLSFHQDNQDLVVLVDGDLEQQVRVIDHFAGVGSEIIIQPNGGFSIFPEDISTSLTPMPTTDGGSGGGSEGNGDTGSGGSDPVDNSGSNGTVLNLENIGDDNILIGTDERDLLISGAGNDELSGNIGDDLLLGGMDDDIYYIDVDNGKDIISETGGTNVVVFSAAISFSDVASNLSRFNDNLILRVGSTGNQVTVENFFIIADTLASIEFSNGSSISASQLFSVFGVEAPTLVQASRSLVIGSEQDNTLTGSDAGDVIITGSGNDTLRGLSGNDYLVGGAGDDVYEISLNSGKDRIIDSVGSNKIIFSSDIYFNDVASGLSKSGDDLVLTVVNSDNKITVHQFFNLANTINTLEFMSGGQIDASQLYGLFGVSSPTTNAVIHDLLESAGNSNPNADDDSDGIDNELDACPFTPNAEAVDVNGCSQSQLDDDGDGLNNLADLCANSPQGEAIDANGCTESQRDSDSDGIFDAFDQCPNTPANSEVDLQGCHDADGDGVSEFYDLCPLTEAGKITDGNGCALNQKDSDSDSLNDELDMCPGTDANSSVNAQGCAVEQLDSDNDNVNDALDQCPNTEVGHTADDTGCADNQRDSDNDGELDYLDLDDDNDGISDSEDAFPLDATESVDTDLDGIGNNTDTDDDGDSYSDTLEITVGTDPLFWSSNPWAIADVKSLIPMTGTLTSISGFDDGQKHSGSPRIYHRNDLQEYVVDEINGLIWQDTSDSENLKLNWAEANGSCLNSELGGITSWRLPTRYELMFLTDLESSGRNFRDPIISKAFKHTYRYDGTSSQSYYYWTADRISSKSLAIAVDFADSYFKYTDTSGSMSVRCVSGDKSFNTFYHHREDNIVYTEGLGLMWQDTIEIEDYKASWSDALNYCENLDLAGHQDWRLPNIFEANTIVDHLADPNPTQFKYIHSRNGSEDPDWWLSNSRYDSSINGVLSDIYGPEHGEDYAYKIYAYPGTFKQTSRNKTDQNYVRCVRSYSGPVVVLQPISSVIPEGVDVILDASQTYDPDGSIQSYSWYDYSVSKTVSNLSVLTLTDLSIGENKFRLTVTDDNGVITRETIEFTVERANTPPLAIAGDDQVLNQYSQVILDASASSDPYGEIVSYQWANKTTGQVISSQAIVDLGNLTPAVYTFELTLVDDKGLTGKDEVIITVQAIAPAAQAGIDLTTNQYGLVTLDASATTAPDGAILTYRWVNKATQEVVSEQANLSLGRLANGEYTFVLTVTDSTGLVGSDEIVIVVNYIAPIAKAGSDVVIHPNIGILLDGSNSTYEAEAVVSYQWTDELNKVVGNQSTLPLNIAEAGEYQYTLQVMDELGLSSTDTVSVVVSSSPQANAGEDITSYIGMDVLLNAFQSFDVDGDAVTYEWWLGSQIFATDVYTALSGLPLGDHVVTLKVTDTWGFSSTDEVNISVLESRQLSSCAVEYYSVSEGENNSDLISYDDQFLDVPDPDNDVAWSASSYLAVGDIETAFNDARLLDDSITQYLKMPSQADWNAMSVSEQGLYLINAERQARGIKPYAGLDLDVSSVAQEYSDYTLNNNKVISHYLNDSTPSSRLDGNATILAGRDAHILTESVFARYESSVEEVPNELMVEAIYQWIYYDKNPFGGESWSHRKHILQTGLSENSGDAHTEGVIGFGITMGVYDPFESDFVIDDDYARLRDWLILQGTYIPTDLDEPRYGAVLVLNTIDQSGLWNLQSLGKVNIDTAQVCNDVSGMNIDSDAVDVGQLSSLEINTSDVNLVKGDSFDISVLASYKDGTQMDVSSAVNFIADVRSIVSVENGTVTGLRSGKTSIYAQINGFSSNRVLVTVGTVSDTSNVLGSNGEQLLPYIPTNATLDQYDEKALSVFTGFAKDRNGAGMEGVQVSFLNHPEYGSVQTDSSGRFIIAAPAGLQTLVYESSGYLTLQRDAIGASNSWVSVEDVVLLALDTKRTFIDLSSGAPQVHQSSVISDEFGTRKATVVFNNITSATIISADGYERSVDEFWFNATEYETPKSMPGPLPAESAFTYCTDLRIEGVRYDDIVKFNNKVTMVVDNFLNFKVGEVVPIGYFDMKESAWEASQNGVVARLVGGGTPGLDYTGDGIADDINGDGSTLDEAIGLEGYPEGETLMYGAFDGIGPVDYNFSGTGGDDGREVDDSSEKEDEKNEELECTGSYVMPYQQSFHEDIPVAGTDLTLHYSSQRTMGYQHKVTIQVSDDNVSADVLKMTARLEIAGKVFESEFSPATNVSVDFIWDGNNAAGTRQYGLVSGIIRVGYEYASDYTSSGNAAQQGIPLDQYPVAWATMGELPTDVAGRQNFTSWQNKGISLKNSFVSQIAEGWSLSNVHEYNPQGQVYKGNGRVVDVAPQSMVLKTGQTISSVEGDDGHYQRGGSSIDYTINSENIIVDNVTGLEWQNLEKPIRIYSKSAAESYCQNNAMPRYTGWRIPTPKEQAYIVDKSGSWSGASIFDPVKNAQMWTTSSPDSPARNAICVRGTSINERYVANLKRNPSLEVVVDSDNGLMWQDSFDNISYKTNWQDSIEYCETLEHAEFDDWRLPNINEFLYALPNDVFEHRTIVEFPGDELWSSTASFRNPYWSSTSHYFKDDRAWAIESASYSSKNFFKDDLYYVRCVRDDATSSRMPYRFDSEGQHTATIDLDSGKTLVNFNYNADKKLVSLVDQFGNAISLNRDSDGKLTSIVASDGQTTSLAIDADNNIASISYEDNSSFQFYYDGDLLTDKFDQNGNRFSHEFDGIGRVIETSDVEGGQWNFFDERPTFDQNRYGFNTAEGSLYETIRTVLPSGDVQKVTTYKDGSKVTNTLQADRLKETVLSHGATTVIDYVLDSKTLNEIPSAIVVTQPSGLTSQTQVSKTYAENGADTSSYTLSITENGRARLETVNTKTGFAVSTSAESRVNSRQADPETLLVQSISPSGLMPTTYLYDARGRLTEEKTGDRSTLYAYDNAQRGNVSAITTADGKITRFEYDVMDRVVKATYPDGHATESQYDSTGNSTTLVVPTPANHSFAYNGVNRVTSKTTPLSEVTKYSYDKDRRLTHIELPSGQLISNTYTNGQLLKTATPEADINFSYINGDQLSVVSEGSETLAYGYDGDLVTSINYAGSLDAEITQGYDNNFWLNSLSYAGKTTALSYDNDGLLTSMNRLTIARHKDNGLPESVSDSQFKQLRTYNAFAETTDVTQKVNDKRSYDYSLTYNLVGQITGKTETLFDGTANQFVYGYDEKSRLVSVSKNNVEAERYEYDANGNRLKHSVLARGISEQVTSYNIGDQLQSSGSTQFEYDDNGRLSKKTNGTAIEDYTYSSQGRLLTVKFLIDSILDKTISYQHSALGNRVAKLVDGVVSEKYLWLNKTTLAAIYDKDDNLVQRFEYGLGQTPISFTQSGNNYYISSDQIGTPRVITDDNGTVVKAIDYDTFGNVISDSDDSFVIPFGFAGGLQDQDTNLLRFGYRDFDPEVGRWTARDPIGFAGGDTNLYGYVASDPVNFIDPIGLFDVRIGPSLSKSDSVTLNSESLGSLTYDPKNMNEFTVMEGYDGNLKIDMDSSLKIKFKSEWLDFKLKMEGDEYKFSCKIRF